MSDSKLLSIGIPTYNRAEDLDRCLESILTQLIGLENLVEVLVSDNASTDETSKVIEKYVRNGYPLITMANHQNVGLDMNMEVIYHNSGGQYLWIFGDDDFLIPKMLAPIVALLQKEPYGIVNIASRWYREEFIVQDYEYNYHEKFKYVVLSDSTTYLNRTHYWITFLTGNIINKQLVQAKVNAATFRGSMMGHLAWFLPALFVGNKVIIETTCIICKSTERGGYKVFETFGQKFSNILNQFTSEHGTRFKHIIEDNMAKTFFPQFVKGNPAFKSENYFKILLPIYWRYPSFWKLMMRTRIDKAKQLLRK